jgi:hypothetical protein
MVLVAGRVCLSNILVDWLRRAVPSNYTEQTASRRCPQAA